MRVRQSCSIERDGIAVLPREALSGRPDTGPAVVVTLPVSRASLKGD